MRAKVDHVTDCVFLSDWRRKLSLRREFFTCVLAAPATLLLKNPVLAGPSIVSDPISLLDGSPWGIPVRRSSSHGQRA